MFILDNIIEFIKDFFDWYKKKTEAKRDLDLATIQEKKAIILSRLQANSDWELAQLNDEDKALRWAGFIFFIFPYVAYFISPRLGQHFQDAVNSLPKWWTDTLVTLILAPFGIKHVPRFIGSTVGTIVDAIKKPQLPPPTDTE